MSPLLLILALALPSEAQAGWFRKDKARKQPAAQDADQGEQAEHDGDDPRIDPADGAEEQPEAAPAASGRSHTRRAGTAKLDDDGHKPASGSLWDFIENVEGDRPTDEAVPQSEELDAERTAEHTFLVEGVAGRPGDSFYTNPLGASADDPLYLSLVNPDEFDIPVVVNEDVIRWMRFVSGSCRN